MTASRTSDEMGEPAHQPWCSTAGGDPAQCSVCTRTADVATQDLRVALGSVREELRRLRGALPVAEPALPHPDHPDHAIPVMRPLGDGQDDAPQIAAALARVAEPAPPVVLANLRTVARMLREEGRPFVEVVDAAADEIASSREWCAETAEAFGAPAAAAAIRAGKHHHPGPDDPKQAPSPEEMAPPAEPLIDRVRRVIGDLGAERIARFVEAEVRTERTRAASREAGAAETIRLLTIAAKDQGRMVADLLRDEAARRAERDDARAEVERLRAMAERLRLERNAFADTSELGRVADELDEDNAATNAAAVRAGAVEIGRLRARFAELEAVARVEAFEAEVSARMDEMGKIGRG